MLISIFTEFFKIGCVAVGGGYTVIPFLYYLIPQYHWYSADAITNMVAVSNLTPGPIGINMATYAGYEAGGFIGSTLATFAVVLPSIIIVPLISKVLKKYKDNSYTEYIMYGLRPAAVALISVAAIKILKTSVLTIDKFKETHSIFDIISLKAFVLLVFFSICAFFLRKQPMRIILLGIVAGIITYGLSNLNF